MSFQNFIKSLLISEVTFKRSGLSVLDLCCGKGGDIPGKWKKAKPCHYVGVDLSRASVEEAHERYLKSIVEADDKYRQDPFPAIFIVADCGDEKNLVSDILVKARDLKTLKVKLEFDVVST